MLSVCGSACKGSACKFALGGGGGGVSEGTGSFLVILTQAFNVHENDMPRSWRVPF